MAEIGTAYVKIEPTAKGISGKITSEMGGIGTQAGESFNGGFGKVLGGIAKTTAAAVGVASAAVIKVTKSAVDSYAEFEQLEGGTKLLFGDAWTTVMKNANNAFSEVQMSTNDYLQTANSYATGLKESLGNDAEAAAELTNKIITAQADIVAATGNSQENVANAFAGIMKNNFTMLDNLQLGIKPTKEGMQEVIDKMNEINGTKYKMGNLADMQSAIVDYVKYVGMAGYAHEEGAKTIQGSLATTKAAWQNLLTGLGNGDDLAPLIDSLVGSAENTVKLIMPIIEQALNGIADLVVKLAPMIADKLPSLIDQLLPSLLSAATSLLLGLIQALPSIINVLVQALPTILIQVINALIDALPLLIDGAIQLVIGLVGALPEIINALIEAMPTIVVKLVTALIENAPQFFMAAGQLAFALCKGLLEAIPQIWSAIITILSEVFKTLKEHGPEMLVQGKELVKKFADGITALKDTARSAMVQVFNTIKNAISGLLSSAASWGRDLISNFVNGIWSKIGAVADAVSSIASTVWSYLHFSEPEVGPLSNFSTYAPDMVKLFAKGLDDSENILKDQMTETFTPPLMEDVTATASTYAPYNATANDNGIYQLLAQYLPLLNGIADQKVVLEGDADGIFRVVRTEANRFAKSTGYSPFPA
mgnify:CR=1 FL=1